MANEHDDDQTGEEFEERGEGPITAVKVDELEGIAATKKGSPLDQLPKVRRDRIVGALAGVRSREPGIELWHIGSPADADDAEAWDLLFRCPSEHEFAECIGKSADKKAKAPDAMKRLAFQVIKYPSVDAFRQLLSKRPGLALKVGNDALAIASEEDTDFARKV